jgi:uncharacterized hydrophobic protein (TIGR00271 family)
MWLYLILTFNPRNESEVIMGFITSFIKDNQFKADELSAFTNKLFFEGNRQRVDLERFAILLFLSTAIATYGVIGDSTATVIGAMIISPLMRPIMAITAGLVMGDMKRASRSLGIVVISVVGVIGVAWIFAELSIVTVPVISFQSNSQIVGRVSPRMIDLYVALWSGVAAAFAMSRDDVADSLPGVAIAIALVPPLCVVGIGLAEGELNSAGGAMLLFVTNFLLILLAGGAVLALLGLNKAAVKGLEPNSRRTAYLFVALAIVLVIIPLGTTSLRVFQQRQMEKQAVQSAYHWVADKDYSIRRIQVVEDQVTLEIYGTGERPVLSELGDRLNALLDRPIKLRMFIVPSEQEEYAPVME